MKDWLLLFVAILGELAGTACLKLVDGGRRPWAWAGVVGGYGLALWLLDRVIQRLDLGVAYAVWSGVGIFLVAVFGVVVLREPMSWWRALGLAAIVFGIVVLQLKPPAGAGAGGG